MTLFGIFVVSVNLVSLVVGYGIYKKMRNQSIDKKEGGAIDKMFVLFFICLLMVCIYTMTFVSSYVFVWEKAYRAYAEMTYEATVIGYKKEIVKTQNFGKSSYQDSLVFFPEVSYVNDKGQKVTKTLDATSNEPLALGSKVRITDSEEQTSANVLDAHWLMLLAASLFISVSAFFASLLSLYISSYPIRRKVQLSARFAGGLMLLNITCIFLLFVRR